MKDSKKFDFHIENYINGNLKDFYQGYKRLRAKAKFWLYVEETLGHQMLLKMMNFVNSKEM